ncbi:GMC oxidoreductase-domain-containing protein [Dunaliella salina]|uniref:GMC oxidoreductase-domain-containing protein n=1 Tax=Dunaliella salina TaxID=3046 RepID=A0ABQ7GJ88_DUNSA|nr:GMC oxidoreductase-domain-containing protein [Dunaliella salina]|eukprot:KAF5834678.1 GMC oxidoreductase-domain-containing protein [Dunaliella salina]
MMLQGKVSLRVGQHGLRLGSRSGISKVAVRPLPVLRATGEKYDAIIVGGGTAGCVLADRLSADENKRVLVLEAGPKGDTWETWVPAGITRLFNHPVLDWGLKTVSQKQLTEREVYLARGKALGGSSCTNATLYHRGTAADYDSWGLEGWKSDELLKWFNQAENFEDGPVSPYHGVGGAMHVERPRYDTPMHENFFKSCANAGLPANPDFNDWSRPQAGYGEFLVSQKKGQRADANRMYLKPAMGRPNLEVVTEARTTKIMFDRAAGVLPKAVGVQFSQGGANESAQLAEGGEVLMCSGAVHSPHLLQLSGIGPAAQLQQLGIEVVSDLPGVGQNLQDHPATLVGCLTAEEFDDLAVTSQIYNKKSEVKKRRVLQYLLTKTGPLATTGCDHGAFLSTTGSGDPDLQMRFVPAFSLDPDGVQAYIKFAELKRLGQSWPCGVTIQLLAVRPKSRGSVGLRSTDPFANPAIDLNYYSDPEGADIRTLREGIRLARNIFRQQPLASYIKEEKWPGPQVQEDADLDAFIRSSTCSGNALVGTCRMGLPEDPNAVVSATDLSVRGVSGVRVVDSSVIPRIPGGQTGAATVMVAERAAAMLTSKQPMVRGSPGSIGDKQLVASA